MEVGQVERARASEPGQGQSSETLSLVSAPAESVQLVDLYSDLRGKREALVVRYAMRREELIRHLVAGHRLAECAKLLRLSQATVRLELQNPAFRERLMKVNEVVYGVVDRELSEVKMHPAVRLNRLAQEALDNMEELMQSENEHVKLKASQDVLDRNNETSKTKTINTNKRVLTLDLTKLQEAETTAAEVDVFERTRTGS